MSSRNNKNPVSSINVRIHPDLKEVLDRYCEEHIEKISEAVTSAIKNYIGFGKPPIEKQTPKEATVEGKPLRLDVRVHPRIKQALQEYCKKNNESITDVVTMSIIAHINFVQ